MSYANEAIKTLAFYTLDLLSYDESLIKFGRANAEMENGTTNYIVIDELASSQKGSFESFDGTNEIMTHGARTSTQATLNFYGVDARANARSFLLLRHSQKSYELQRDLGLAVFNVGGITDLRQLTGTEYSNRFEVAVNIQYTETATVNTLRIDVAQTNIINDK